MMKRIRASVVACGLILGLAAAAPGQPPEAGSEGALCGAVEEGLQLLEANGMAPDEVPARAALLHALIRSAEPTAEFLDDAQMTARQRRMSERDWDAGLTLVAVADGLPKVAAVREDSPAATAGIQAGELIERIGDRDVLSDTPLKTVCEQIAAGEKAELELKVRDGEGVSRVVSVERVRRAETSVAGKEDLPANIGYLRMEGLYPGAGEEMAQSLREWADAGKIGVILDLRGAGGQAKGEIPAVAVRYAPAPEGLYTISDRKGIDSTTVKVEAEAAENPPMPLMVLVDEGTTGASELLAAVLAGSTKGTMLIGRKTAGDPMIREAIELSTGDYVLLPTREVKTADGTIYAGGGGVMPDVLITDAALNETVYEPDEPILRRNQNGPSEEEKDDKALRDRTRNDTYLRRATDMLLGLQALGYDRKP